MKADSSASFYQKLLSNLDLFLILTFYAPISQNGQKIVWVC